MTIKANTEIKTATVSKATTTETPTTPDNRLKDVDNNYIWTVIGVPNCPWTAKAIQLLQEHKENYKVITMTPEWQRRVIVEHNTRRSPAIFKNHAYIGSYDSLENYYKCSFFSDSESFI